MAKSRLHELDARGVSVWFDTLSRELIETGELKRMMDEDVVTGVTSNPTIFQKALSQGTRYDAQLTELLETTDDPKEIFIALAARDVEAQRHHCFEAPLEARKSQRPPEKTCFHCW